MELYASKNFPDNYPQKVLEILDAFSMTGLKGVKLVGSASIRSQLYAGDYDASEEVKASSAKEIANGLKMIVKKLRVIPDCFIGDIKCGEVPEWNVFSPRAHVKDSKIIDFNITQSQSVVDTLKQDNVISSAEAKEFNDLLSKATTPLGFLEAKKSIRVHILRWLPSEILDGSLEYRGHSITLEEAILSKGMVKVDAICNISDRFTEFSMIYDIFIKGHRLLTYQLNIVDSLKEDILFYNQINPFKALKRIFALSKALHDFQEAAILVPILNSDLGRLYQIIGDLKTLASLLARPKHPMTEIRNQIDSIKARSGNIYQLKDFLSHEHGILGSINSLLKTPMKTFEVKLMRIISELEVILSRSTVKEVQVLRKHL